MIWFDNLSLRGKLAINFFVSGGVLVAAIVFCILQIRSIGEGTAEIAQKRLPAVQVAAEISQLRLRYRVRSLEYMQPGTDAEKAKIEKSLGELDTLLGDAFKRYEPFIVGAEERGIFTEAVAASAAYRATVNEAVALAKASRMDEAQELRKTAWVKEANRVRDQTDALQKLNRSNAEAIAKSAAADAESAIRGSIVALATGVALAFIITFLISRRLSSRLEQTVAAARRIAGRDLASALPPARQDEIGKLAGAMGDMQAALRDAMRETAGSASAILNASRHLNDAVQQIDHSATVQTTAASAIAANVEELTVSINVVASNTSEAAKLAEASDAQAGDGHQAIGQLIGQITEVAGMVRSGAEQIALLKDESEKISAIVAVIRDIADQTNLLALNAAIEAARAGEQGRGFAVVADEVRKLSERTALATNEIAQMVGAIQQATGQVVNEVERSVRQVDGSVTYAEQAGDAIARLREIAQRVAELIGDVDVALREQSAASTEVARKIEDIAAQSEEASAVARQTSAAADSLDTTAHDMQSLVARFRIT
ncbi:MAG: methyl-accepting chemotaxis protein [Azospira sp.]|jgi:methyl-accepting chemotaxis protein|nr:methyl-accepting chemotaxis protein [Azospira sp.]